MRLWQNGHKQEAPTLQGADFHRTQSPPRNASQQNNYKPQSEMNSIKESQQITHMGEFASQDSRRRELRSWKERIVRKDFISPLILEIH